MTRSVSFSLAAGGLGVGAIPEIPMLIAPSVAQLIEACDGRLVRGGVNPEGLARESMGFVIAAMSLPNVLARLHDHYTVIAPGDRYDLLPGLVLAHYSATFPNAASIVLTGGYPPPEPMQQLIDGLAGTCRSSSPSTGPTRRRPCSPTSTASCEPTTTQDRHRAAGLRRDG